MKKRILYNILNEWRDEDMDDSPIDIDDDISLEQTSPDMDNEPDLDDDDFALSTTQEVQNEYEYFPETRDELKDIVDKEIEKQGGVYVNLNMIDTSKITDMLGLFYYCTSLKTLDVSRWNVSNVNSMQGLFYYCTSLETLDVSRWDVSKVEDMRNMFSYTSLHLLDVSRWDVSNVKYMTYMFYNCESLETLDVSRWNVSNVTNMYRMFGNCKSLHTDTRMWKINTEYVTDMYYNAPHIKHN